MIVPLGLMVPDSGVEARGGAVNVETAPAHEAPVHLVGATRIPSSCAAVVTAEVSSIAGRGQPVVLEPDDTWLAESRLQVEDSLLDPEETELVRLVILNPTSETKRLDAGCSIGQAIPCVDPDQSEETVLERSTNKGVFDTRVNLVQTRKPTSDESAARKRMLSQMLDFGEEGLTPEEVFQVRDCVLRAQDVFSVEKGELGNVGEIQHCIETGDSPPVRQPPRRVPFSVRPEISRMVNEMMQARVIQESSSPWASPVVLVRMKDGSLRFCVDYR